jgi:hypothetical protein
VDRVYNSLDYHIDAIGISGADIVAKLHMAVTKLVRLRTDKRGTAQRTS